MRGSYLLEKKREEPTVCDEPKPGRPNLLFPAHADFAARHLVAATAALALMQSCVNRCMGSLCRQRHRGVEGSKKELRWTVMDEDGVR